MKKNVPFYSQKWDLSRWREFGFESYEDAEHWERSSCGVLCLKMAIDAFLMERGEQVSPPVSEYIRKGVAIGAYTEQNGWSHDGLVRLAGVFGFSAKNYEGVKVGDLKRMLEQGRLPIVSIKWAFENTRSLKEKLLFWKKFGGHLALVVGFEEEKKSLIGFYVHHTSIQADYNRPYEFVSLERFKSGFTGRCIVVKPQVGTVLSA